MSDFQTRFGENGAFAPLRAGCIVSLFCAGTFFGCFACGWLCDRIGRRYTLSASSLCFILGILIEITSTNQWVQFTMGRFVSGLGVGALSTGVPMYQSESIPSKIRGVVVAGYQLLISFGMFTAYLVCPAATLPLCLEHANSSQDLLGNRLFEKFSTMAHPKWFWYSACSCPWLLDTFVPGISSICVSKWPCGGSTSQSCAYQWCRSLFTSD